MNRTRQFLLIFAAAAFLGASTIARAQESKCSGTVTDAAGHPLAGAVVEYWQGDAIPFRVSEPELKQKITTEANGAFAFQVSQAPGILLAQKPGLAPAWQQWRQSFDSDSDEEVHLVLAPPAALAGVVVDQADKPVANAQVFVAMAFCETSSEEGTPTPQALGGKRAHDCFAARTDAAGHFRIENFPTNATATLAVQAPGKALSLSEANFGNWNSLPWHGGQQDIKLVMEPAGCIEGKIIVEGSRQPPPVARLTLEHDGPGNFQLGEREPASSGADGAFHFGDVAAGSYRIRATFGTNATPEWVAETVQVSVESGQPARGVDLTATRGGLLEVTVLGENDHKPLVGVTVGANKANVQASASSDSNGIALLRLPLGDYQVMALRESMAEGQTSASAEDGKTNRVEIEIAPPHKITGLVRQPDGHPAAGVRVRIVSVFSPGATGVKTDAEGKFELKWNPRRFGQNDTGACILARDVEHNLAVAQEIDEDSGPLDLKLAPGLTLAGRVESDGQPITNATAALVFWNGPRAAHLSNLSRGANTPGRFEITALPPGRKYGIHVSAPGYGQKSVNDVNASEQAGRMELDPIELKRAAFKLAGQVLDEDEKPVAGVNVQLNGEDQPNGSMTTDSKGRFHFQVCEGQVRLFANGQQGGFAQISADAGDTNVVLELGQNNMNAAGSAAHKLTGTVTDADGKPAAGAQVAVLPSNGQQHWAKTATNGAFSLRWSLQPWQRQNGGALLVVRKPALNLGYTEELDEDTTNVEVKLKPALTVAGLVKSADDSPLAGAHISVQIKSGNSYEELNNQTAASDAQGRYQIKGLPPDAAYLVTAIAKDHGRSQQEVPGETDTNRVEVSPFVLRLADHVLAGQVLDADDKPVRGVNVQLNGEDQPNGNMTTDRQGRFHFKVCEGQVQLFANGQQGGFAQTSAEADDTNVVLQFGQNNNGFPGAKAHKLKGTVKDPDGKPVAGARLAVFPVFQFNGAGWKKTDPNGAFRLTWSLQPWQMQQGGAMLVVRDPAHTLGASEALDEDTTNLEVKLKPALTVTGLVQNADESPLAGAKISLQIKTGNNYGELDEPATASDAQGRFQIKGLPPDATYLVTVSAKGRSQSQQPVRLDSATNSMELLPFVLKLADRVLAGQVLNQDDKPVPGANVSFDGLDQPNGNMTTDSKGRFHFQVCEGSVHLNANDQQGGFAQASAEAGDTNVVLQFGQNNNGIPGTKAHKLTGTVTDAEDKPAAGAQVAVFPDFQFYGGQQWKRTATNGAYKLTWTLQPWQMQNGGAALLVAREPARHLAAAEELQEKTTNLDLKLKPALTVTGLVKSADGSPLAGAQVNVQIKAGNSYGQLNDESAACDAQGRYQIKDLPADASYFISISAKGHGNGQSQVQGNLDTNRMELSPVILQLANLALAGQVLNEKGKPVAGANVSLNGQGQPNGNMTTDSKGRFHFQVCDGQINLFANSPMGGGFAQGTAEAGDTNVVLTFGVQQPRVARAVRRVTRAAAPLISLKGSPLPDLASVSLASNAAPGGQAVLLCLFDAGQRPSRQVMRQLNEQAAALRDQSVTVLGVQALITGGEIFNQWKSENPVSFPLGRVTEKSDGTKWVLGIQTLPWLILTDAQHKVVAEGFTLDDLDAELKKLAK